MFGMMIDIGPKVYSVSSPTPCVTLRSSHRLRTFMSKFYVKVFRTSLFPNPMMDLVHVWYDDRYWSKIHTPIHDLKVKVTDLETFMLKFYVKVFRTSLFLTLWYICFMFVMMIDAGPKFYQV